VEKADLATALNYANQAIQLVKNYAPAWAAPEERDVSVPAVRMSP